MGVAFKDLIPAETIDLTDLKGKIVVIDPRYTETAAKADQHLFIKPGTDEFVNFEKDYWSKNTPIGFVFSLGVVMGFVVGIIIVYQVLSTDVNDHIGEYATFKAMGYRHIYFNYICYI